jgi:hypothetical protein
MQMFDEEISPPGEIGNDGEHLIARVRVDLSTLGSLASPAALPALAVHRPILYSRREATSA